MVSAAKKQATKKFCPMKMRPYNRFNLFFILERELILQSNPEYKSDMRRPPFVTGFEDIEVPSTLPARYANITIPEGWYLPGRSKARSHTKSKNLIPFAALSKAIAQNYKNVDKETFNYLDAISKSMVKRSKELKAKYVAEQRHAVASLPAQRPTAASLPAQRPTMASLPIIRPPPVAAPMQLEGPLDFRVSSAQSGQLRRVSLHQMNGTTPLSVTAEPLRQSRAGSPRATVYSFAGGGFANEESPRSFVMTCVPCINPSVVESSDASSTTSSEDEVNMANTDIIRMWMNA